METTLTKQETEVSDDVRQEAVRYADGTGAIEGSMVWSLAYQGFLAGAAYMKPVEHEQKPIYGYGKESENHTDNI